MSSPDRVPNAAIGKHLPSGFALFTLMVFTGFYSQKHQNNDSYGFLISGLAVA
jgi:hypothetical protein